jgi:hypothetical protein
MTDRIHIDRLSSDDLDELYAERDQLAAVVQRGRDACTVIETETADWATRHNPDCGCEVISTTAEILGRIRTALDNREPK